MNKNTLAEMLKVYPLTDTARKSVANRIESALSKNGTPAQLLSSASQSLKKRAEESADSSDYGAILGIAYAFEFALEVVKAGKEGSKKERREYWAESQEAAIELKAKAEAAKPSKPAKAARGSTKANGSTPDLEALAAQLAAILAGR